MWTCPKCGREFKNTGQDHFCGKAPADVGEYIEAQPEAARPILQKVRETIRAAAPDASEKIAWQMPTFWQGENIIHFAAFKKHLGVYPGDLSDAPFADRLRDLHTSKGAIRFPFDRPVDYALIADITRWRVSAAKERQKAAKKGSSADGGKTYTYDAVIREAGAKGGAYVAFPYDLRSEFGKGRVRVHVTFDGEPYDGSIVNMGVKNEDGSVCHIIGIRKEIRASIGKQPGDSVRVTVRERDE